MGKNPISIHDVPEVAEYLAARSLLDELMGENPDIFQEFHDRCEQVNIKRQAADKAIREKKASCGPWDIGKEVTSYDATKLYEALGREKFLEVGGKLTTQSVYDLDKIKIGSSIKSNKIPEPVAEAITTVTPHFTSPEQILHTKDIDVRSDLDSFGATLYFAASGCYPFDADSPVGILRQHLNAKAQPIQELCPDLKPAFAALIDRCIKRDRDERPSITEFQAICESLSPGAGS